MEETKIDIKILKSVFQLPIDAQTIENAIFVEDTKELLVASQIELSGKYNRTYTVVSHFIELDPNRVLIDNDLLIIILFSELAIIDLQQDKLLRVIDFNCWELFRIFKFKSGYFLYGEGENRFLNKNFDVVWEKGCIDIFVNPDVKEDLEIFDNYVTVFDWYGYKHYYDETGEFKTEHYPEYDNS
ncbi:MAG: hypothetical protein J1F36_02980 [Clostridiales bacterium]|nr:hypothetical protein [Clostridiales bacterium]